MAEDGGDGMVAEDVIYKVSVQRWPLQQLPPVAFDGIITPLWCIFVHHKVYLHSFTSITWPLALVAL